MLRLNNLKRPPGSHRPTKRRGRGQASGQGTQGGRGHKGQKSRKSGRVRTGFEGGSMPLYMRLPKGGFKNAPFKKNYATISLGLIEERFVEGEEVSRQSLTGKNLIKGKKKSWPIKILLKGEIAKKLKFVGIDKFSKGAEGVIKQAQGEIVEREEEKK